MKESEIIMNIEKEIFKRTTIDFQKLEDYGFKKENNVFKYSKVFMNSFRADLIVNEFGILTGSIYDIHINDEYINYRIESQNGEFVNKVRYEYKKILEDIKMNCTNKLYFINDQTNRITNKIIEKYHDEPEFAWEKSLGFGIFRNQDNNKWYALIMNIDKSKIAKNNSGEVEVVNLKLDPNMIIELLKKDGYYPAYHMNKKYWITVILDDTLSDNEIMELIIKSHQNIE